MGDLHERQHFDEYVAAYQDVIKHTAKKRAPWYVVPADKKWFTRLVVASAVVEAIASVEPAFPQVVPKLRDQLQEARAFLEGDGAKDARPGGKRRKS
jgi:hypothetical protein